MIFHLLLDNRILAIKQETFYHMQVKLKLDFIIKLVFVYFSNVDLIINRAYLSRGFDILKLYIRYDKFPIIPELDSFFDQVMSLLVLMDYSSLIIKAYFITNSIISVETFLRFLKIPLILNR